MDIGETVWERLDSYFSEVLMSPCYALTILALLPLPTEPIGGILAQKGPNFLFPPEADPTARLLTVSTGTPDRTVPDKEEPVFIRSLP
jgi:hypothetical protein